MSVNVCNATCMVITISDGYGAVYCTNTTIRYNRTTDWMEINWLASRDITKAGADGCLGYSN